MHLNGEIVKIGFEGQNLQEMGKWIEYFMFMKTVCPQGGVCPCPGSIYMFMTIIFKHLL